MNSPNPMRFSSLLLLVLLLSAPLTSCAPTRTPLPPGEIPTQGEVSLKEEEYGQQVFRQLSEQFELDRSDERINRARRLVDQITTVRGNNQNIWHVYVFKDDTFHNAGATRGNYLFVWSALMDSTPDDNELAAILAHEVGHVLAGHTKPNPMDEVREMLANVTGSATQRIMIQSGGSLSTGLAGLGGALAAQLMKALILNPDKQADELEADQLGLFLMAEAGFDPRSAISFWTRSQYDPNFQQAPLEFLSTHPSSETRLENLKKHLNHAMAVFEGKPYSPPKGEKEQTSLTKNSSLPDEAGPIWVAAEESVPVYTRAEKSAQQVGTLRKGERVVVRTQLRRWLQITSPYEGFVESPRFSPLN
ncbi:M48 family metalloprotease [bacterium]|nr:M48 family metalloprotease [bacterium]